MDKDRVYLDYNATTPLDPRVRTTMNELYDLGPLNPGSQHAQGRKARALLEEAEHKLLKLVGLESTHHVVFCGSATEAINLAIRGYVRSIASPTITLSSIEHPAVAQTVESVATARVVPVDRNGLFDLESLQQKLKGAHLATFMCANNETGLLLPINEIAQTCRKAGVPLLLDACQAPAKCDFSIAQAMPEMLVLSSHKMYGPLGVAALIVERKIPLKPLLSGGGQQHGMRPGTESVVAACALVRALELAIDDCDLERARQQCDTIFEAIRSAAPEALRTLSTSTPQLANTLHYRIPGLSSERQVIAFDMEGIECSAAAACESGAVKPSKVMLGMGFSDDEAKEGIRLSVGRFTSDREIEVVCEKLPKVLGRLMARAE